MNQILSMREKRANLWDAAKKYRETHIGEDGTMSAEDAATYDRMVDDVDRMKNEIERLERQESIDDEMNQPTSRPVTSKPMKPNMDDKTGRASDAYRSAFWAAMRNKSVPHTVFDALQIGTDSEGGYLCPDEYERTLVEALQQKNIFRPLAHVIRTSSGDRKIPISVSKGTASWIDEEASYPESDDSFGQLSLGAHKLATMIKISEELLNDSVFDMPAYIAKEFARRIGAAEEEAFFTGNGTGKPLGVLAATGGAQTGATTASATAVTFDEIIDLYYSLREPYRNDAVFIMNDATVKHLRKIKKGDGEYIWQPATTLGTPDRLLNRPVYTSSYMPTIAASAKTVLFGDLSYYWIADREGRQFKRLNELYATTGQVGFLSSERVDGKLILPEAVKVLVQHT